MGNTFANVEDRYRSMEFIALLKKIDAHYPPEALIRVVLDNHSAYISRETVAYLSPASDALSMCIRPSMAPG